MLIHSPPLPLDIEYRGITAEDEEAITLALKQRDRVRRVRLRLPSTDLQSFIVAIDEEYPILEYLIMHSEDHSSILIFPETFRAPHLCHLALGGFTLSGGSRLLTTAVDLVTLHLIMTHSSTYFYPNSLFQWLSLMPQLENLVIIFSRPVPDHVERQLTCTPIMTSAVLPNLCRFTFRGFSTYLEALVYHIIAPRLKNLQIGLFLQIVVFLNQFTFSVPRLQQFMDTTENLRFDSVKFKFSNMVVDAEAYLRREAEMPALSINASCLHLDEQVTFATQFSNSLSQMFSAVEHLTLEHEIHSLSSEKHNEVDRIEWRKLLGSFSNVKTLCITHGLVKELLFVCNWTMESAL
jgi:hypothetical protein